MNHSYGTPGGAGRAAGWVGVLVFHALALLLFNAPQLRARSEFTPRFVEIFAVANKSAPVAPASPRQQVRAQPQSRTVTPALPPPALDAPARAPLPSPILTDDRTAPAPDMTRAPHDSDLMHSSRLAARKDDRDHRKGKLAGQGSTYTPFAKMQAAMAGAYTGGPVSMSSYTSPDGVVITRIGRGGGGKCYMAAQAGAIPSAANANGYIGAVSGGAREVNCPPADSGWRKQ